MSDEKWQREIEEILNRSGRSGEDERSTSAPPRRPIPFRQPARAAHPARKSAFAPYLARLGPWRRYEQLAYAGVAVMLVAALLAILLQGTLLAIVSGYLIFLGAVMVIGGAILAVLHNHSAVSLGSSEQVWRGQVVNRSRIIDFPTRGSAPWYARLLRFFRR